MKPAFRAVLSRYRAGVLSQCFVAAWYTNSSTAHGSRVEGTRPTKADGRARIGVPSHPGRCESGVALPNETGDELTLLKPSYVTIFCPPAEVPITSGPRLEKRADLPPGFFAGLLLPAEKKPKPTLENLFADVYHEPPESLLRQEKELHEHLAKYDGLERYENTGTGGTHA